LVLALSSLLGMPLAQGQVYKWVDERGRIHYTDRPPREAAEPLVLEAGPSEADRRAAEARAERLIEMDRRRTTMRERQKTRETKEAAERQMEAASRRRECGAARRDLATLREQRPVYTRGPDGENVFIGDEQRVEMIGTLETLIAARCSQ
jgi:hypothetical protein